MTNSKLLDNNLSLLFDIDSFKARIPFNDDLILPKGMLDELGRYNSRTGEILLDDDGNQITEQINTVYLLSDGKTDLYKPSSNEVLYITCTLEHIRTTSVALPYIVLHIPSKIIGSEYLQGITFDTIPTLFNFIAGAGLGISLEQLLDAEITDVDFKADIYNTDQFNYDLMLSRLKDILKPSIEQGKGMKQFYSKLNKGFQVSDRASATISNPYIKVYWKKLELATKSKGFRDKYLIGQDLPQYRIEYTLKNKKHLATYKLGNTLKNLLEATYETKRAIHKALWAKHTHKATYTPKTNTQSGASMQDVSMQFALQFFQKEGRTLDEVIRIFKQQNLGESTKKRVRKLVTQQWDMLLNNDDDFNKIEQGNRHLEQWGII